MSPIIPFRLKTVQRNQNKIEDVPEVPILPTEEKQPEPKPEPIRIQAIPISKQLPAVENVSRPPS